MNKQIREFVKESHLDVYGLGKDRANWEATVLEFTQMIVKECVDIADTAEPYKSGDLIKKHFGVKL